MLIRNVGDCVLVETVSLHRSVLLQTVNNIAFKCDLKDLSTFLGGHSDL